MVAPRNANRQSQDSIPCRRRKHSRQTPRAFFATPETTVGKNHLYPTPVSPSGHFSALGWVQLHDRRHAGQARIHLAPRRRRRVHSKHDDQAALRQGAGAQGQEGISHGSTGVPYRASRGCRKRATISTTSAGPLPAVDPSRVGRSSVCFAPEAS